jgi:VIT1/CCC1 family predicted Fe2+/Mn2+ transporter
MARHILRHIERHAIDRIGWLRAAVLGANDGVVSTASLIIGVAAAGTGRAEIAVAGVAALVAGAMSMAAGEYVSVSSQADAEKADLEVEKKELEDDPEFELRELQQIYVHRGLEPALARQVAEQLMAEDALGAHARDELQITALTVARPIQAAAASAASFTAGAALPLAAALLAPHGTVQIVTGAASLLCLGGLGAVGAKAGGAGILRAVVRVVFWGAFAMGLTSGIGALLGAAV